MHAWGGMHAQARQACPGSMHARGCVCPEGACVPGHMHGIHAPPPRVNKMIDTCENFTLLQTSFVGGKNAMEFVVIKRACCNRTSIFNDLGAQNILVVSGYSYTRSS